MRCVFVAIGWENISLQALSATLKTHGHEVHLVYDQALFDDKNYLSIKWMARLLDQKDLVLQRIIELQPDLVGFNVLAIQYQEMRQLASELKKRYRVPVLFGGIHPHSASERVLLADDPAVDMICRGEGEHALLELCNCIDAGKIDYSIKNLWFRLENCTIIKNDTRPPIPDIDALPSIDKELFAPHVPLSHSYLACPTRGCPYKCTYCSLSFLGENADMMKAPRVRERSVDSLIDELKSHIQKYQSRWVDFRQPVMYLREQWALEFFARYKKEIALPFRCFGHPLLITEPAVRAMKEAGCFAIQMGLECWDPEIRNTVLNRHESNDEILRAISILEKVGQPYALDYILGLPRLPEVLSDGSAQPLSEEKTLASIERELMATAELFAGLQHCYRIAPFMVQYMPGTRLIEHGITAGDLSASDVDRLERGLHDNYMALGSLMHKPARLRLLLGYRILFRLIMFLPRWGRKALLKTKLYKIFWMAPFRIFISLLDLGTAIRDVDARTYVKNYWWWFRKRFDRNYHLYYFKKKVRYPLLQDGQFELPVDGMLRKKSSRGWETTASEHRAAAAANDSAGRTNISSEAPSL
jgi:anaerobic magnesium-protoporphyrin IX monomethyl ester cyclase